MADDNEDDDCALQGWIDSLTASFNHCWWSPETFNPPLNQLRSDWWSSSWNRKWDIKKTFLLGVQKWSITWISRGADVTISAISGLFRFPPDYCCSQCSQCGISIGDGAIIQPNRSAHCPYHQHHRHHRNANININLVHQIHQHNIWIIKHLSFIIVIIYHLSCYNLIHHISAAKAWKLNRLGQH